MDSIETLQKESLIKINNANTLEVLNELRIELLGKKGLINDFMIQLQNLDVSQKAVFGKQVNELKVTLNSALDTRKSFLEKVAIEKQLESEKIDLSLPSDDVFSSTSHVLNNVIEEITNIFIGLGFSVAEGFEVEEDLYNFELLNIPKNHPARDMQDTFYINENLLLRTHTSPVQARTMLSMENKDFLRIICPGVVFRRDEDDATHSHQFTQIEGLVVDKTVSMADLYQTLRLLIQKMFGSDRKIRFRSSYFPFTEPSVEVDVSCAACQGKGCSICKNTGYIEILGAGMVHPNVLDNCGFSSKVYQGYAFGLGIERFAMLKYGINDIRHFYNNDIRVLKQFKRGK